MPPSRSLSKVSVKAAIGRWLIQTKINDSLYLKSNSRYSILVKLR